MIIRSLITLILLAVYLFAFEFQYLWYREGQELVIVRLFEIASVLIAGLFFFQGKYVPLYIVLLLGFCLPAVLVDVAFNWILFAIVLVGLAAHGGLMWLLEHLKAR